MDSHAIGERLKAIALNLKHRKKSLQSNEIWSDYGLQVYDQKSSTQPSLGSSKGRFSHQHSASRTCVIPLDAVSFSLCCQNQHEIEAKHSGVRLSFSTQTSSCLVESHSKEKVVQMSHLLSEISPLWKTLTETDTAYCRWLLSPKGIYMLNEISHQTKTLITLKFPQYWTTLVTSSTSLNSANPRNDSCTTLTFIGLTWEAINDVILQYKSFKASKFRCMKWYTSKLQNTDNFNLGDLKELVEDAINLQVYMALDIKCGSLEVRGISESVEAMKGKVEEILYRPVLEPMIQIGNIVDKVELSTSDEWYFRIVNEFLNVCGRNVFRVTQAWEWFRALRCSFDLQGLEDCMVYLHFFEVFRINNSFLEAMFDAYSAKVTSETNGAIDAIKHLWHGTDYDSAQNIFKSEFNRSYCGKNGTAFGQGVYFASRSSTSLRFCRRNRNGVFSMIYAKVATGRYSLGCPQIDRTNLPADVHSTVDNLHQPSIFVVYHDAAAFPSYEIQFTSTCVAA